MTDKPVQLKKLFWQVPLAILLLIALGNAVVLVFMRNVHYTGKVFLFSSINSVLIGGAFMAGIRTIVNILDRKLPWLHHPKKRVIVQFLVTITYSLVLIVVTIFLTALFTHKPLTSDFFFKSGLFMGKVAFTFLFVSTLLSNAVLFFKNWKEAAVQQEKLKREQLSLQYETLKSQVNPHFLFNSLNSLTSLISSNPEKAIDFVKRLSEIYRYILDQKDQELVKLGTEMEFVESYIFLQKIRFGTNLEVQIGSLPLNVQVIPLSVQLLVENAIRHNEISDRKPLIIRINSDGKQYLTLENRLQKKSGSEGTGLGLQNIVERYAFFSDRKVIICEDQEKFIVSIPLLTE